MEECVFKTLSSILLCPQTDAVSCQCLTYLVEKVGQSLTQFNVSGNTLTGFTSVLKAMSVSNMSWQLVLFYDHL